MSLFVCGATSCQVRALLKTGDCYSGKSLTATKLLPEVGRVQEEVLVSSVFFLNQCLSGHPFLGGLWLRHHQLSKQALRRSGMCVGKGGEGRAVLRAEGFKHAVCIYE